MTELVNKIEKDFEDALNVLGWVSIYFDDCEDIEDYLEVINDKLNIVVDGVYCEWTDTFYQDADELEESIVEYHTDYRCAESEEEQEEIIDAAPAENATYIENLHTYEQWSIGEEDIMKVDEFVAFLKEHKENKEVATN